MMKEEVDDYVLEERLGQGTSGQVFKGIINSYVNIHTKFDQKLGTPELYFNILIDFHFFQGEQRASQLEVWLLNLYQRKVYRGEKFKKEGS